MKILQKRFAIPLIIAIIIIIAGVWLYFQFSTSIFLPNPVDRVACPRGFDCKPAITGTPEQKEKALDEIRYKVQKYNVATIPEEDQTKIEEIAPFIPSVIEAILDSTPLPRHEDTGWGNVSHYANTIMHMFAYRFDGIRRERNPIFSFNDATEKITDEDRKLVHDNWLNWWNANKYLKINKIGPWSAYAEIDIHDLKDKLITQEDKDKYGAIYYYGNVDTPKLRGGLCGGCASSPSYVCVDTNKLAEKIKIYEPPRGIEGGVTRYAIVCDKDFWILNQVEINNFVYGPFSR